MFNFGLKNSIYKNLQVSNRSSIDFTKEMFTHMPKLLVIRHVIALFFALMHIAKTASTSYLNRIKNQNKNQQRIEEVYFIFK